MPVGEVIAILFVTSLFAFSVLGIFSMFLKHRRSMAEIKYGSREKQPDTEKAQLVEKMEHMADRLAVLEQIATDPAAKTAREIESLR